MMKRQWFYGANWFIFFFCIGGFAGDFQRVFVNEEHNQFVDARYAKDGNVILISSKKEHRKWSVKGRFSKDLGVVQPLEIYTPEDHEFLFKIRDDFSIEVHKFKKYHCALYGHQAPILALRYQSMREQIRSFSADKTLKIWRAKDGVLLADFKWETSLEPIAASWSPDQKSLLIATKNHRFFAMRLPKINTDEKKEWLEERRLGFCFIAELFWPLWLYSKI